jgi:hypothetical protein
MPNMNSILFYSATTPGVAIPGPDLSCKFLSFSFFFAGYYLYSTLIKTYVLTIKI